MNKYLKIIEENNLKTLTYIKNILIENNKENNIFLYKDLYEKSLKLKIKKYNKEIKVLIKEPDEKYNIKEYRIFFIFKNSKTTIYFEITKELEVKYVPYISISYDKVEISFGSREVQWFLNKRKYSLYLTMDTNNFNKIGRLNKRSYLYRVGITIEFINYFNKYIAEMSDYMLLKKDFNKDLVERILIEHDDEISLEHDKLSKIRLDVRKIFF